MQLNNERNENLLSNRYHSRNLDISHESDDIDHSPDRVQTPELSYNRMPSQSLNDKR
jgi:hypothetical protein